MARSIRRGSSRMRSCGFPTPRIRLRWRSSIPPKKSITSPVTRFPDVRNENIRLLIVKSRRPASSRASIPSVRTVNWRCPGPVESSERASATSISSPDHQVDVLARATLDEIADDSAYEVGGSAGAFRGAAELRDETPKVLASAQGAKHPGGNLLRDGNRTLPRFPAGQLSCDPVLVFGEIVEVHRPPHHQIQL